MLEPRWVPTITQGKKTVATELVVNGFSILVHKHVHASPDIWFMSCDGLKINIRQLESRDLKLAKLQAIQIISLKLEDTMRKFDSIAGLNEEIGVYADRLGLSGILS